MKKILAIFICLFMIITTFAQEQKFSATAAFPFAVGDFDYVGLADIGLQYRLVELGSVTLGASANAEFLQKNDDFGGTKIRRTAFLVRPRVFGELNIASIEKLKTFLGLGYSWVTFKSKVETVNQKDTDGGFNLNLGGAYDINDTFFVHLQFDSTRFASKDVIISDTITGTRVASTLNSIKIGIGFRF
jgi:opacity protein-like surface antigen